MDFVGPMMWEDMLGECHKVVVQPHSNEPVLFSCKPVLEVELIDACTNVGHNFILRDGVYLAVAAAGVVPCQHDFPCDHPLGEDGAIFGAFDASDCGEAIGSGRHSVGVEL